MMPRRNWISWLFAALPAILGIIGVILALLPYGILKPFLDSIMPDGNFNSLKPWNADVFKLLFGLGGLVFLCLAVLTGLRRWNLFASFSHQFWIDAGRFFVSLRPRMDDLGFLAAVLVIMVLAVIYRLEYINSPLHHDEAYTYVAFAHSLISAVTDYHLPNNHVFHTILVFLSTRIFGIQPWAVRLPAFTAGVLLVPAVYWLAKRLYDRWTALAAALLVAWLPTLVTYSTNARGYTLVALFTLLTLTLGNIVLKEKNLFVWMLISLFSALGIFTLPVMLFPFGILFVWLFLGNQVEGTGPYRSKLDFLRYWVAAGFSAALLTGLFYTPILIFTGSEKVFANGFVAPLPWANLVETLSHRFSETWVEWTSKVPLMVVIILAAGWTLSLIFHRRLSTSRVPLQLAALLWIAALIIIQRPDAWAKVWLFLLPLMLLWAAAGTVELLVKIQLKFLRGLPLAGIVVGLALLAGIQHAAWLAPQLPVLWAGRGSEEKAVLFVQSQLRDGDLIIVAPPDDAPVWYYSELHGINNTHLDPHMAFDRAFVLVDTVEGQTPASVIAERGPEPGMVNVGSCDLLDTFGKIQVYGCAHE
jgi:hypothetical protein